MMIPGLLLKSNDDMITRLVNVRCKTIIRMSHRMIFIGNSTRDTPPGFVPLLDDF